MKITFGCAIQGPRLAITRRTLTSERGVSLIVVIMLMVIILAITSAGLLFSGLDLKISSNFRAGTRTFYAADTGVSVGVSQLQLDQTLATAPFSGPLGDLNYRSGRRNDNPPVPQPLQFRSITTEPGFSIGVGTGYNPSGYAFYNYQINVTGTGLLAAAREIEAQAEYGPVPQ